MGATLTDPAAEGPSPDTLVSLRPNRKRWRVVLQRSTAALDVALRAFPSADRGEAPLSRRQRLLAAGAALAGLGGVGSLAALASFRPDLGPSGPAILCVAIAAAGLPAVLCVRRAVLGASRHRTPAMPADASPDVPSPARDGLLRRLARRLHQRSHAAHRQERREERHRERAVSRARADIAARERRLAKRIAAGDGPREDRPMPPAACPIAPGAQGLARGHQAPRGDAATRSEARRPAREISAIQDAWAPWALPRDVVDALADLAARERLHDEKVRAARRAASQPRAQAPAAQATSPARPAPRGGAAAPPNARRHARITPLNTLTFITTQDGRKLGAVVLDVSQSGVAIEGDLPGLWIGSMVTVGSRRAKVVRTLPGGMACEFSMPIPAEALTADFVL